MHFRKETDASRVAAALARSEVDSELQEFITQIGRYPSPSRFADIELAGLSERRDGVWPRPARSAPAPLC